MWIVQFVCSSIGKKWLMAASGLFLIFFLFSHAAGNATIFYGGQLFQSYADQLHSHPLIVSFFSTGLFFLFATHVITGLFLFFENLQARPAKYKITARAVKNSWASRTMPYTGLFILLFVLVHTFTFSLGDEEILVSNTVEELFSNFFYSLFYIISFTVLALHISHGFWSMLQTFGINHPRYSFFISRFTIALPVFFLVLFGSIPFYFLFGGCFY